MKEPVRESIKFTRDAFKNIGKTVNDRLDQIGKRPVAVRETGLAVVIPSVARLL